ncbi:cytochrome-c peroxidase [Wenyingzhuangia sp. 2_MG-2023]|uniref:cytochrome-c peroxidase n=1 Tax=Wenyingzhuangia sp. 2_MG-2023 TaxID=3062639 RepID=UPI0026E3406B|nr:cytochrome c peroxidase [Wenyingzhuangia sp. 2_MG-2023]MDO6738529.1 cytochrome c peroxidase [Wenyingzhuangia sp. 2_MG-2023]
MNNPYIYVLIFLCFYACQQKRANFKKEDTNVYIPLPKVLHPKNNLSSPEKIHLGKLLFYDPILSGNKDIACATCHHPNYAYAENIDLSIGTNATGLGSKRKFKKPNSIPLVKRNAHTILNTAYNGINIKGTYNPEKAPMFWDNRAKSLEEQALMPITTLEEMRGQTIDENIILDTVIHRLKNIPEYRFLFQKAFPNNPVITTSNLSKAIACFERTLSSNNSRFDNYLKGETNAISETEKEGFRLFKKAKCNQCHSGPMFSDYKIHTLGLPDNQKLNISDDGFKKNYGFRTPTLRNLRHTGPYMHNGTLKTLLQVLEFYEDISTGKPQNPLVAPSKTDPLAKEIRLKVKDMSFIISFFNTLNNEDIDNETPKQVPSGLTVGGAIYN